MFMVRRLGLFQAYDQESKASHQLRLEVLGNRSLCFRDSDLEVTFRRNTCLIRNLEGVDLLKGNRTTNLYTINLHDMASASLICLMARSTSTKSWLWHQRLSHLNFDTINDLARSDLVTGLPKALCYPKNDHEDIGKLGAKGDIGFFIGYSANSRAYRVYNRKDKENHGDLCGQLSAAPRTALAAEAPQVLQTLMTTTTTSDTVLTYKFISIKQTKYSKHFTEMLTSYETTTNMCAESHPLQYVDPSEHGIRFNNCNLMISKD
ncbi:integrase, catalytic region, zinc finger, CCHC-type containing protein [Tanacetum coccineum]